MRAAFAILAVAALCAAVVGCASVTDVQPIGKDTYTVGSEMGGQFWQGGPSWPEVKGLAMKRANEYCGSLDKNMVLVKTQMHGARGWTPLGAEITFRCLASDDPAYQQPSPTALGK